MRHYVSEMGYRQPVPRERDHPDRLDPRVVLTRERVLAAVGELLRTGGGTDVTHSAVARAAGVGRATVYRHWPSIDDLLADAIEHHMGVTALDLTGDPLRDLRTMILTISRAVLDDTGGVMFTTLLAQGSGTSHLAALRVEIMVRRIGALRQVIDRGIEEGAIDPTLDADDAVSYLFGPLLHRRVVLGKAIDESFVDDLLRRVTRAG